MSCRLVVASIALVALAAGCGGGAGAPRPDAPSLTTPDASRGQDGPAGTADGPAGTGDGPAGTADAPAVAADAPAVDHPAHPAPADAPSDSPRLDAATEAGNAGCLERRGGALIVLGVCSTETFTVWVTSPAFIDEAIAKKGAAKARIPIFDLVDGRDCDPTWTWHVNPATPTWADLATEVCDGCPRFIENDKASWIGAVKRYCPWSALVVSVDDRRP